MNIDGDAVIVNDQVLCAVEDGEDAPETVTHPQTGETIATIAWRESSEGAGYFEATPVTGWCKVGEGCDCGVWDDTPPGTSSAECEAQVQALAEEYGEVVLVLCGGSNPYATQYDLLARDLPAEEELEGEDHR